MHETLYVMKNECGNNQLQLGNETGRIMDESWNFGFVDQLKKTKTQHKIWNKKRVKPKKVVFTMRWKKRLKNGIV